MPNHCESRYIEILWFVAGYIFIAPIANSTSFRNKSAVSCPDCRILFSRPAFPDPGKYIFVMFLPECHHSSIIFFYRAGCRSRPICFVGASSFVTKKIESEIESEDHYRPSVKCIPADKTENIVCKADATGKDRLPASLQPPASIVKLIENTKSAKHLTDALNLYDITTNLEGSSFDVPGSSVGISSKQSDYKEARQHSFARAFFIMSGKAQNAFCDGPQLMRQNFPQSPEVLAGRKRRAGTIPVFTIIAQVPKLSGAEVQKISRD